MDDKSEEIISRKTCIRCGESKPLNEFSFDKRSGKYINTCKACKVIIAREHYEANKAKKLAYASKYREEHRDKINEYQIKYREDHGDQRREYSRRYNQEHQAEIKEKRKVYRSEHLEEFRARDKRYAEEHKEQIAVRYRQWAKDHKEQLAKYNRQYRAVNASEISRKRRQYDKKHRKRITAYYLNKRATDPLFKVSTQVRNLINKSLNNRGYSKDTHTYEIIGCDYETLWAHLKKSWFDNYGSEWNGEPYHVDHIIPLATAKTKQEVLDLCYYENLQLLKPEHNLQKNKSLDWSLSSDEK